MKTAWFCGTFDPVHIGHLHVAAFVKEEFHLDLIRFLPAGAPPNKPGSHITPGSIRITLLKTAIESQSGMDVSDTETRRSGPSYMIDTVREIIQTFPEENIILMMGQDNLETFNTWKSWEELIGKVNLIVFRKSCKPVNLPDFLIPYSERILFSQAPVIEINSTDIRNRIQLGQPIDYFLPESVRKVIFDLNLYNKPS